MSYWSPGKLSPDIFELDGMLLIRLLSGNNGSIFSSLSKYSLGWVAYFSAIKDDDFFDTLDKIGRFKEDKDCD